MEDFKNHLADQILSEEKIVSLVSFQEYTNNVSNVLQVTYRALSRALRVNVNVAKQYVTETKTLPSVQALICA